MTQGLNVLAISYRVAGTSIPARLTLKERETFAIGAGLSKQTAAVIAMQDRASSLANVLGTFIKRSGDPELIALAERSIEKWNAECEAYFKR